jgi:hypothetical protein
MKLGSEIELRSCIQTKALAAALGTLSIAVKSHRYVNRLLLIFLEARREKNRWFRRQDQAIPARAAMKIVVSGKA